MATENHRQNQQSRSLTTTVKAAATGRIQAVLLAAFLGALLFAAKVQAGLFAINPVGTVEMFLADPTGTIGIALVVWLFVGVPAAGGVFLADR
jgi:hypothetical protein